MKRVLGLVLAFTMILTVAIAGPQEKRRGGGQGFGPGGGLGFPGRIAEELNLTEAQKSEIKNILAAERSLMQPIRDQLMANREQLQALENSGQFNEAKVTKLAQEQGNLTAQMIVSRVRVQSQIRAVLTPEQRQKADELRARSQERRDGAGRRGGGRPPSQN